MIPILYLIDKLALGGTEKQLAALIRQLDPERFQPHLATIRPSSGLFDELAVPKLRLDLRSYRDWRTAGCLRDLVHFVRQREIRIVQTFFQDSFVAGALLRAFCPVTLIGSFRDLGFWRSGLARPKMRLCYPFYNRFIANSGAVKAYYAQEDRIPPGRIEVIYNGIQDPSGASSPRLPGPPVIGIVGNFNRPVKRMNDFVLAAASVRRRIPEARFVVVGDGGLMPEMVGHARRLGLADAFTFTGRLADPVAEIRRFSVGVITSESEGFCNAILEYMACALPVVATDTGGNGEMVFEGCNGFLVPVGDTEKLAARICELLGNPELAGAMGAASLQRVRDRFTLARMTAAHERLYRRLLAKERGSESARQ